MYVLKKEKEKKGGKKRIAMPAGIRCTPVVQSVYI
jgi:hypothetical protein